MKSGAASGSCRITALQIGLAFFCDIFWFCGSTNQVIDKRIVSGAGTN
jgi:hypothetical protein